MPFEFGLDLGCRWFGDGELETKRCLVLESKPYRFQTVLSDMAGQDPKYHHDAPDEAITVFADFTSAIPEFAEWIGLDLEDIQFVEYVTLVEEWLALMAREG